MNIFQTLPICLMGYYSGMDLPFDTILEILSCLEFERSNYRCPWYHTKIDLQPYLFSASLINKAWNEAAELLLYKDVFLASSMALETFLSTLRDKEDLRSYVRSIFFTRAYSQEPEHWMTLDKHASLEQIYAICPNIRSRWVNVDHAEPNKTFLGWREIDFGALTRLEIRNAGVVRDTLSNLSLPMLEELVVRGLKHASGRKTTSPWPKMSRLRRLCLIDCNFSPVTMCLPRSTEDREGLRALEIVGGEYSGYGLRGAIRDTCRSLELLTFLPSLATHFHVDFPSLRALRISSEHLRYILPNGLPPYVMQIVLVGGSGSGESLRLDLKVLRREDLVWHLLSDQTIGEYY